MYIDTILGKDGGYILRSKFELPLILFNENDVKLIDSVIHKIDDDKVFDKLNEIKQKIINYCKMVNKKTDFFDESKKNILEEIEISIKEERGIKIEYNSNGGMRQRRTYPKQIYLYEHLVMIVVQYSEDSSDIRHLNLDRITRCAS